MSEGIGSMDGEIDRLVSEYPYLKGPHHFAKNIFYQDWPMEKSNVAFLGVFKS